MKAHVNQVTIEIMLQEILHSTAHGLVNATDPNLTIGPQLAALVGPEIIQATKDIGWCDVGSATTTSGGKSRFSRIIHVVGPRWGEGSERGKLANATWQCLQLAEKHELTSIVFPAISTGVMGYPVENCAVTMLTQIIDYTFEPLTHLKRIEVNVDNKHAWEVFLHEFQRQLQDLKSSGEGKVRV